MIKAEENIQIAVCNYIRVQYPKVIFFCDVAAGMKLTIGQAVKAQKMRSSRGIPDLFIAEPVGTRKGLFIELKKDGTRLTLKDGQTPATEHIREQAIKINQLSDKGYSATFAVGFDQAKVIIDNYMKGIY